ncbi:EAL domain-containing protein [Aestuariibacter halophilus]|uniref:EAL domain-containing protein n=1 Tax=Fluctibacter halophilus TaxID=226011 RepID=A0ABS8GBJ5_9ALTE|nr:EAL domain-containing protein [Aestuariibacter halophilus]MCC2617591.1 EAL domain-containing protein [Aestuariibacter halophilus]
MSQRSLNQSILRLVVGLVLLTALTILANVWTATSEQARNQVDRELTVAENVLRQALDSRAAQLYNSASVLTADFGFKQAVATRDRNTIESVLLNHGQRIEADLMAVTSLKGDIDVMSPALVATGQRIVAPGIRENVLQQGGTIAFLLIDGRLYQTMFLTVDAPTPIAIAMVGFEVDQGLARQLKNITRLETTIHAIPEQGPDAWISTLPDDQKDGVLSQASLSWLALLTVDSQQYLSQQFDLNSDYGLTVQIILSSELSSQFEAYRALQANISLIALLAIVLSLLIAFWLARKVARPIVSLAGVADAIARGDYQPRESVNSELQEFNQLSEAFEVMQGSIKEREDRIVYQANHDPLTLLHNRYHIETLLEDKFASSEGFQTIGINIFGFRGINDVFGYHNGDQCLRELASRVAALGGMAARLTGGELLWIPTQPVDQQTLERVKQKLEQPIESDNVVINLKVAMGILTCPEDASSPEHLFRRLNIVLDEAQITRQLILPYDTMLEQRYLRRLSIISELKRALVEDDDQLSVAYQPKLNLKQGRITGVEALLRWNNPALGFVSPDDFISVAEQAGFIGQVTDWVINRVVKDIQGFTAAGISLNVAINLSAQDVLNQQLLPGVLSLLDRHGVSKDALSFEITESDLVKDPKAAIVHLQAIRDAGFSLAIDDFGTGYSSMAYLKNLPVNTLKVDKSFVLNLDSEPGDQNIVQTVIELAHTFDMSVVAEGIENQPSLQLLADWGCEWAQGYFICKPIPAQQLIDWYAQHQHTDWLS